MKLTKEWETRKIQLCKDHFPLYGEGASDYAKHNCDICRAGDEIKSLENERRKNLRRMEKLRSARREALLHA